MSEPAGNMNELMAQLERLVEDYAAEYAVSGRVVGAIEAQENEKAMATKMAAIRGLVARYCLINWLGGNSRTTIPELIALWEKQRRLGVCA